MKACALALLSACILTGADQRYSSRGNTVVIEAPAGRLEFEWLTSASFHVVRDWGRPRETLPRTAERIDYRVNEQPASLILESRYLAVEIGTPEMGIEVRTKSGQILASQAGPQKLAGKIVLDTKLASGERIYGLGQSGADSLDLRGRRITSTQPFYFTTAGYGINFAPGIKYLFDVGATSQRRMRVTAQGGDRLEYSFYYGPSPKEIFEMRRGAIGGPAPVEIGEGASLCDNIRRLNVASASGLLYRAPRGLRPSLDLFLRVYDREREDRGLPVLRPLVMEFPHDGNAHRMTTVSMLGDELLIAPRCAGEFALPQGTWTDLDTGRTYRGRERFTAASDLALLARNGSIVPIQAGGLLQLHYFPKLAAEFFIYEPEVGDYTQLHAAPATDYWRLEIESKVRRTYEWVVHDPARGLRRVRVEAQPGGDHIVNLPL